MNSYPQHKFLRRSLRDGMPLNHKPPSMWDKIHLDPWLLGLLLLISSLGLVILYSASGQNWDMVSRQAMSFGIGFFILILFAQVPPRIYQSISPYIYLFALFMLMLVFVIGETRLGAKRWISIPGLGSMQPSEIMKFAMPLMMAWYISRQPIPPKFTHILGALVIMGIPFVLVLLQPDLNIGLIIPGIMVLFFSGLSWKIIFSAFAAIAIAAPLAWTFVLQSYQKKRIETLFNPDVDPLGAGWNITQSKIAIGSGGLSGKGYLEGTQSHHGFLPEQHTDFVISTYAEEFGFIGILFLYLIYILIISRCLMLSAQCFHTFGRLFIASTALTLFFFVFLNAGMGSGILPVTGDPLPFMSYGGTAIIALLANFGIIMSVHTHK